MGEFVGNQNLWMVKSSIDFGGENLFLVNSLVLTIKLWLGEDKRPPFSFSAPRLKSGVVLDSPWRVVGLSGWWSVGRS